MSVEWDKLGTFAGNFTSHIFFVLKIFSAFQCVKTGCIDTSRQVMDLSLNTEYLGITVDT